MLPIRAGRRALTLCVAGLLAVAVAGCGGGGGDADASSAEAPPGSSLELVAGPVHVESTGNPGVLADSDRKAIVDTIRRYVIAATIDPLHGKPVGDLEPIFTPPAVAALAGLDRVAALDEGIPEATSDVKVTSNPLFLTALSDASGAINLVGSSLYLDAKTETERGPVRVKRSGELVLSRDAGTWKIASFRLSADRTGAGLRGMTTTSTTGDPQS
jgi:hypothetical protein